MLALFLLLTACGREKDFEIDPTFQPMLNYYLSIAPDHGHLEQLQSIQFDDVPNGDKGITEYEPLAYKGKTYYAVTHIKIRRGMSPAITKAAVLHELGHALHGLHHVEGVEIMAKTMTNDEDYWAANWEIAASRMFVTQ